MYAPYGAVLVTSGSMPTQRGYTGQLADPSGLQYYHARYYDPSIGQFISADTVQGPNRYAYVGGNPETLTDPTGHGNCGSGVPILVCIVLILQLISGLVGLPSTIDPVFLQSIQAVKYYIGNLTTQVVGPRSPIQDILNNENDTTNDWEVERLYESPEPEAGSAGDSTVEPEGQPANSGEFQSTGSGSGNETGNSGGSSAQQTSPSGKGSSETQAIDQELNREVQDKVDTNRDDAGDTYTADQILKNAEAEAGDGSKSEASDGSGGEIQNSNGAQANVSPNSGGAPVEFEEIEDKML